MDAKTKQKIVYRWRSVSWRIVAKDRALQTLVIKKS